MKATHERSPSAGSPPTVSVPSAVRAPLAIAAIEEFIDAKIAFAGMVPEQRRFWMDALQAKRDKAVARLASAIEAATERGGEARRPNAVGAPTMNNEDVIQGMARAMRQEGAGRDDWKKLTKFERQPYVDYAQAAYTVVSQRIEELERKLDQMGYDEQYPRC